MAVYGDALEQMGPSIRVEDLDFLDTTPPALAFRRDRSSHGTRVVRIVEGVTREVMQAALTMAGYATVVMLRKGDYRQACPVALKGWRSNCVVSLQSNLTQQGPHGTSEASPGLYVASPPLWIVGRTRARDTFKPSEHGPEDLYPRH